MTISKYCSVHDAYYNDQNEWLEALCSDQVCDFCVCRPEKHESNCECLNETN